MTPRVAPAWIGEGRNTLRVHARDLADIAGMLPPGAEMRVRSILHATMNDQVPLSRGDRPLQVNDDDLAAITTALGERFGWRDSTMPDQTDEAIAARERTRARMEGDRPQGAPPSPGYAELTARARLWDKLTELVALAIPLAAELVREAEEERAEAAERRARMEARHDR